uniref:Ras and Rab interactor 3 n=1 Tax=Marmota marmota marmota TaxID=9994 RepID=A0A8C6A4I2_MARMA
MHFTAQKVVLGYKHLNGLGCRSVAEPGTPALGSQTPPVLSRAGKGEDEEKEDRVGLGLPAAPKNCLPRRGISVLEKLVKTCPVWLQLGLARSEAARILHREVAGMFLVRRDSSLKRLVLCVHFPSLSDSSSEVLEYTIKEEKSQIYCPSRCGCPRPSLRPAASRTSRPSPTWAWVSTPGLC